MYFQGTLSYVLCMCKNGDIKNLHVSGTLYLECGCAKLLPTPTLFFFKTVSSRLVKFERYEAPALCTYLVSLILKLDIVSI